jgi:carbon-monoxide dehydrogenase large subunit
LRGRGRYVANLDAGQALHAAIVRSPEAHGILGAVEVAAATAQPGVVAVFTARDMAQVCRPWHAEHALFAGARVPGEMPLAHERVRYVGEPVAIVVADSAEAARDAAEAVTLEIHPLPPMVDPGAALAPGAEPIHPDLAGGGAAPNLHHTLGGSAAPGGEGMAVAVALTLSRVAPQPMETRAVLAEWDAADGTLTIHQSHQHPHMMQDVYSRLLGIPEHRVRVVCEDVGGAFGGKQQLHPDEMATVCAARLLARPVRFVATRSESLLVDAQARDHRIAISCRLDGKERRVTALAFDDLCGVGAFGHFPRTSFGEAAQAARLVGAPYSIADISTRSRLAFQNRPHLGHYRGVGHPVACLATEAVMDKAARATGEHPIAFRRRHLLDLSDGPVTTPAGIEVERYRMAECLDALEERLADAPRGWRGGRLHGLGTACLVELVASGSRYYGEGGVNISSDETAVIRMEPSGVVRLATANTDQGQGADQALMQIVADVLAVAPEHVAVTSGDSANCPYGGGAFGSRGTTLGGKAARDAALRLRERLLAAAGLLLQRQPSELSLAGGAVVDTTGNPLITLAELARTCQFKPHIFPPGHDTGLTAVGRHTPPPDAMVSCAAFGATASVDPATGVVILGSLVAVHDGGTAVNPAAVRAQIVGGAVQGLGQALLEAVRTDEAGQPLTGSFMDYAMPRADDVPPVDVIHLPPLPGEGFAPRGVGEAGASGAPAAIVNAVNDALAVAGAEICELPVTAERVWRALRMADVPSGVA